MTTQDPPSQSPVSPEKRSAAGAVQTAFVGPNGIRAGWRLLVAVAIFSIPAIGLSSIVPLLVHATRLGDLPQLSPVAVFISELTVLVAYLIAAWIMSMIEGRHFRDYGLGREGAFSSVFRISAMAGFAALGLLLGSLRLAGVFHLGELALHGREAARYGALWGITFLTVGVLEETLFRGYVLFTLSSGMTFWPAAMLSSVGFAAIHLTNSGENRVGILGVAAVGLFFCILTRKTGNLWAAIGFHAAWDWGETYFYGVPDSGVVAPGHLFNAQFAGREWLTGGSAGPEASWFCLILLVLLCIGAAMIPGAKYPNPDALPDPRRREAEAPVKLFGDASGEAQS